MEEKGQPIVGPDSAPRKSLTHVLKIIFTWAKKNLQKKSD